MAYRVFPSGQVPTAEIFQKYFMNQVVVTCVSTARPPSPPDGMTIFETDTSTFRVWISGGWAQLAKVGQWEDDGDLNVAGALTAVGAVNGATVNATGAINSGGLMVSRLVKGKVGTGTTATSISASTDSNLGGANIQNVPVVNGRAYKLTVALDYFRSGAAGALARIDFKAWNGTVGTTQLGGTVRHGMSGPLVTGTRHQALMTFVWAATSTTTIANINITAQTTDATASQTWQAEVNAAYLGLVEEIGLATTITNL